MGHIETLRGKQTLNPSLPELRGIISLGSASFHDGGVPVQSYDDFAPNGTSGVNKAVLEHAEGLVTAEDVVNLQFTSGE